MTTDIGIPRKVLAHISETSQVHNDCLAAGSEACCSDCSTLIIEGFDHFYGDLPTIGEKLAAIMSDFVEEMAA